MPLSLINRSEKIGGIIHKKNSEDGRKTAEIYKLDLLKNQCINSKGREWIADVLAVTFKIDNNVLVSKKFIFDLVYGSPLVEFISTVMGETPTEIHDLEKLIVGRNVIIEIKNNTVGGRTYSNVVGFQTIEQSEKKESEEDKPSQISALFDDVY